MIGFLCYKGEDKMSHYFTNEDVKSELRKTSVKVFDKEFIFNTDNGVFSKRGLDFGSRTLINTILEKEKLSGSVLDIGCGYGVIGIILSSFFDIDVDMVDVNKRALHLTGMNIKENKVSCNCFYSDIYENVTKKYNAIVTNPPIRVGKEILYKFLFEASNYLVPGGALYFVVNKDQGAKSTIKDLEKVASVEVLEKYKGFFIIKCVFN